MFNNDVKSSVRDFNELLPSWSLVELIGMYLIIEDRLYLVEYHMCQTKSLSWHVG